MLPKDTLVTLSRSSWNFYKVKLTTGEEGYIASDDIQVASAALVAAATAPRSASSGTAHLAPGSSESRVIVPESSLDPLIEPTPIPNPSLSGN
jgi:hypothetical protein